MGAEEWHPDPHCVRRVLAQERAQQVRLVPAAALARPLERILERVSDVVDVDPDARPQPREHLEHEPIYVARELADVARVDEQDVAGTEPLEQRRVHVLHALFDQLDALTAEQLPQAPRIGLDEAEARARPEESLVHVDRERRGMARAHLDHLGGPELAQEAVVDEGVDGGEEGVVGPIPRAGPAREREREVILERCELPQALEHRRGVDLYAGQPARRAGEAALEVGDLGRAGQRRVEVPRLHPERRRARDRARARRDPPQRPLDGLAQAARAQAAFSATTQNTRCGMRSGSGWRSVSSAARSASKRATVSASMPPDPTPLQVRMRPRHAAWVIARSWS